ncbi:hypothetical protein [Comamonas aquatica]|uniref:hypothetical protein n=1 Tax=Comamonas aquatica TaxID=225991 RepID=UPI0021B12EB3|nr:hypothetical protein [Comamonas aquatica]
MTDTPFMRNSRTPRKSARLRFVLRVLLVLKDFGFAFLFGYVSGLFAFYWMLKGVVA